MYPRPKKELPSCDTPANTERYLMETILRARAHENIGNESQVRRHGRIHKCYLAQQALSIGSNCAAHCEYDTSGIYGAAPTVAVSRLQTAASPSLSRREIQIKHTPPTSSEGPQSSQPAGGR